MKKNIIYYIVILLIASSIKAYAMSDSSFDIKLGISYPNIGTNSPDVVALDSAFAFNLGLDKYFALGLEAGLNWVEWKYYHSEDSRHINGKQLTDALTVPMLLNAIVFFDLRDSYKIMPYLTAGVGYSLSFYLSPGKDLMYGGFTWQTLAGTAIRPVKDYFVELIIEVGYRGISMSSREFYHMDMSGLIARAGVRFSLGILDRVDTTDDPKK